MAGIRNGEMGGGGRGALGEEVLFIITVAGMRNKGHDAKLAQ